MDNYERLLPQNNNDDDHIVIWIHNGVFIIAMALYSGSTAK